VFTLAAPPQFLNRRFQQNGDCAGGIQRVTILLLHERPAAQRQYKIAAGLMILQQSRERRAFHASKPGLTGRSKNLSYGFTLALFDHSVEIKKIPAQAPGQCAPDGGFSRSHKPDEDHASHSVAGIAACAGLAGVGYGHHIF
jgi:hypothetical protein